MDFLAASDRVVMQALGERIHRHRLNRNVTQASLALKASVATVLLWGEEVGAVAWDDERGLGRFEYADRFLQQGFELAPLMMPRRSGVYAFPELNRKTFQGLPGLLADALP